MTDVNQSGKKFEFSIDALNDVLTETKSIKKKLSPFIANFQKLKMQWIFDTFNYLKKCMSTPKSNLTYKFNALYAIKVLLDTSDFILVNWIQVFFLQNIEQIVRSSLQNPTGGKDYFLKLGYTVNDEKQIQKFGFNYTLLALQMLQVGALVKPFRLFQNQQTNQPSQFSKCLQKLKQAGFKPQSTLTIYSKPQAVQAQVLKFKQSCKRLTQQFTDIYQEFSNRTLENYLSKQHKEGAQKYQISILDIYESGDLFLSSSAIETCKLQIQQMSSLLTLKNSLRVLHRLMLCADYETFFVLNFEDTLNNLILEIVGCDKVDKSLKRGSKFLSKLKNPEQSVRIYELSIDLLQKWAEFAREYSEQNQNIINKVVLALKLKLKIQFPKPQNFQNDKKTFDRNKQLNQMRNAQLSEEIQPKQSLLISVLPKIQRAIAPLNIVASLSPSENVQQQKTDQILSSKKLGYESTPSHPETKTDPFIKKLNATQQVYDRFLADNVNYDKNRQILLDFSNKFEDELLQVPEQLFQEVSERAYNLNKQILQVIKLAQAKKNSQRQHQRQKSINSQIQTKKIQSQVFDDKSKVPSRKNLQNELDTPVKRFQMQDSQRNKVGNVNLNSNSPAHNERFSDDSLGYGQSFLSSKNKVKPQQKVKELNASNHPILKIGYNNDDESMRLNSNKQLKASNQSHNANVPIDKLRHNANNPHQMENSNQLHHRNQADYYQVNNQNSLGYPKKTTQHNRIQSHHSIKKTESPAYNHSHKRFEQEGSIKSNSRVQKFELDDSRSGKINIGYANNNIHRQKIHNGNKAYGYGYKQGDSGQNLALQEDFQENLSVNKPKQFKSIGRPKVQSQNIISSRPTPSDQFAHSRQSNNASHQRHIRQTQQIKPISNKDYHPRIQQINLHPNQFNHEAQPISLGYLSQKISKQHISQHEQQQYEQLLEEDQIDAPDMSPLEQSFHDITQIEERIKSKIRANSKSDNYDQENDPLSFKNCFEADKYILQQEDSKRTKMYWLENDTNNLIKTMSGGKKDKVRISKINVPQILQQRNKKYMHQLKSIEEEKNRKIKQLQSQIKNLQHETQSMKDQLHYHKEEIKTLKANSDFDKQSIGQRGYLLDVENIAAQKINSPTRFGYSAAKAMHLDTNTFKDTVYLDPKGKLISSKAYKKYFDQFSKQKQKKILLKSKDLLYKDKQLQIGFMSRKQSENLIVSFYITPERDIQSLTWSLGQNDSLRISCEPKFKIYSIRTKKQQKIFLTIQIRQLPYALPQIEFSYRIDDQMRHLKLVIPCAFHKFIFIKENEDVIGDGFSKNEGIIRGEEVPYSRRMLKSFDNLKDYFQSMSVLNKGLANSQGEISYGGLAHYRDMQFPVRISIKPNQFLYVQGSVNYNNFKGSQEAITPAVQYYISLVTHLLMKEID